MYLVIRKKQFYLILFLIAMIVTVAMFLDNRQEVSVLSMPTSDKIIFIDPGHGGFDPGRTGIHGAHEREINLKIGLFLKNYLESSGAKVYMTRADEKGLYLEHESNKKRSDMRRRKEMVNESDADILVSIHQNYFTQSKYKGGQVFYHDKSEEGKRLALLIQDEFVTFVDKDNNRQAKPNENYYMLRETQLPAVIVECGFISNPEEEALLNTEEYQQKIAWAIYVGIIKYFSEEDITTS